MTPHSPRRENPAPGRDGTGRHEIVPPTELTPLMKKLKGATHGRIYREISAASATGFMAGRPGRQTGRVPAGLWIFFLGLAALGLLLMGWKVYRGMRQEISLRMAAVEPKLGDAGKGVRTEEQLPEPEPHRIALKEPVELLPVVPGPVPPPPPPPMPDLPLVEAPPLVTSPPIPLPPVSLPVVELPPVVPPPVDPEPARPVVNLEPAPMEVDAYPLVFTPGTHPGDSPMLRNWKMLALYSLTVVTLAQPAPIVAGGDNKPLLDRLDQLEKNLADSFGNIRNDLKAINKDVTIFKNQLGKLHEEVTGLQADALKTKFVLDSLGTDIGRFQKDLEALRKRLDSEPVAPAVDKVALEELRARLIAIEKAILSLQPATPRTALSPPEREGTKLGRVMLVNNYSETLLFVINDREFRVPAMTTQPIEDVPAGSLSYEVISPTWGLRARRATSLGTGETFTLTAQ